MLLTGLVGSLMAFICVFWLRTHRFCWQILPLSCFWSLCSKISRLAVCWIGSILLVAGAFGLWLPVFELVRLSCLLNSCMSIGYVHRAANPMTKIIANSPPMVIISQFLNAKAVFNFACKFVWWSLIEFDIKRSLSFNLCCKDCSSFKNSAWTICSVVLARSLFLCLANKKPRQDEPWRGFFDELMRSCHHSVMPWCQGVIILPSVGQDFLSNARWQVSSLPISVSWQSA